MLDEKYIYTLISHYDKKVGVIGSEIILRNGKKQKPYCEYVSFPATLIYYLKLLNDLYGVSAIGKYIDKILMKSKRADAWRLLFYSLSY